MLLPRLRAPPTLAGTPPPPLGARRRDEPRQPRTPLLAPPPAGTRGRVRGRGRSRLRPSLPKSPRRRLPEPAAPASAGQRERAPRRAPPHGTRERPAAPP